MRRRGSILLVEDERLLRGLVSQFLRGAGFRVVEAADGAEGVERFGDSGPFDLGLIDLNLPIYSGVEVCRRIRGRRPDQPIIICSAYIADSEPDLLAIGVDRFLTKPYHPEDLLATIDATLSAGPHALGPHWASGQAAPTLLAKPSAKL